MDAHQHREFAAHWRSAFGRVSAIPFVFLGVGLYRAWLSIFFRFDAFPGIGVSDYFLFESAIGIASLALAFAAGRMGPLWQRPRTHVACAALMTAGAALLSFGCFALESPALRIGGLVLGGAGLGALILMWAEFYGSLNPLRVALYHALAISLGEAIKWLFMGLDTSHLVIFAIALPPVCFACVHASMKRLPEKQLGRPSVTGDAKSIPWKPIVLMATCTFAAAFGALPNQPLVGGNIAGALFVTALVFFGVLSASKWFNFDTVYQLAFPLFIVGFLFVMPAFGGNGQIMAFCYDAGYTMLSMYIMIVLSNITYRFGVSAVWLNGIERGIRYLVELAGWLTFFVASSHLGQNESGTLYDAIAIVVVLAFLVIFFTERGLSAKWGIVLDDSLEDESKASQSAMRASDLSRSFGLTPREEEVLQLLAQHMTVADIERALFVSQGTVKAHISHIYRKIGIHSKGELFDLLEGGR
ncbi:LuxR family transcriptional regulator [Berryella intestinalis]|uniref:LuxR family transcriptional regulator n=1 Tax=Berryella intestinalis TaxID=1531429 RepID=A0A0A8B1M5_9ACTN|nr:helix-turn-helix transcriptional regulator [Berryella intestinalis]AJC11391.1 LuxR family transcriptional regulator [Berryella intestinalis]